jgi:hypothetical protein
MFGGAVQGRMLLLLVGASGSGKTAVIGQPQVRSRPDLAVHDFDEIEVPNGATPSWRQSANEAWLQRILAGDQGQDVLLAGQTPLGELLATPSAVHLDAIACYLLDCRDATRLDRLEGRTRWTAEETSWHLAWAAWLREHARDPQWHQDVIRHAYAPPEMRWERWTNWQRGDPRWQCERIDTSDLTIAESAAAVGSWVERQRATRSTGALTRANRWWETVSGQDELRRAHS